MGQTVGLVSNLLSFFFELTTTVVHALHSERFNGSNAVAAHSSTIIFQVHFSVTWPCRKEERARTWWTTRR